LSPSKQLKTPSFLKTALMIKSRLVMFLAAIVLLGSFSSACPAQAEQESRSGLSFLLSLNGIDHEIELTEEQRDRLFSLWVEVKFELDREFRIYKSKTRRDLTDAEKANLKLDLQDAIAKIREKETDRLEEALLPNQLTRLKQLRFQYLTKNADGLVTLQKELKLTLQQVDQIGQIRDELKSEIKQLTGGVRAQLGDIAGKRPNDKSLPKQFTKRSPAEIAALIVELRADAKTQVTNVLNPEQRRKLDSLQGEAYDFNAGENVKPEGDGTVSEDSKRNARKSPKLDQNRNDK
jgi:Spy/CpxP family protein refolding chaperone